MALPLPFLVGVAIGSASVLVFNKRKEICDKLNVCDNFDKAKDLAKSGLQTTKEIIKKKVNDLKNSEVSAKVKTKKEEK